MILCQMSRAYWWNGEFYVQLIMHAILRFANVCSQKKINVSNFHPLKCVERSIMSIR